MASKSAYRKASKEEFLRAYKKRLMQYDKHVFSEFENAYISTYVTYNTTKEIYDLEDPLCNYGNVLLGVCVHHGINIKGVTSERKHHGSFISPLLNGESRDTERVIYVGKFNYFTGKKSHPLRPIPSDRKVTLKEVQESEDESSAEEEDISGL